MLETLSGRSLRSAPNSPGPATPRSPSKRKSREASVFAHPNEVDSEAIDKLLATKRGQSTMRAHWVHGKSVSSAYWDPRGRSIVSTCYDDTIRCELSIFELEGTHAHFYAKCGTLSPRCSTRKHRSRHPGRSAKSSTTARLFVSSHPFPLVSFADCFLIWQGKWLTILKAQWTPNPDVYPHFTVRVTAAFACPCNHVLTFCAQIGNMDHSLDIFSCKGDRIAKLADRSK